MSLVASLGVVALGCTGSLAMGGANGDSDAGTPLPGVDAGPPGDAGPPPDAYLPPPEPIVGWPTPNDYSWDGSWTPSPSDFPMAGLFDDRYFDGHSTAGGEVTPILPPGNWDWDPSRGEDTANWRNFEFHVGHFVKLMSGDGHHYGWDLVVKNFVNQEYTGAAGYYDGSPGVDRIVLGPRGTVSSFGSGNLGDGPDILQFDGSWSLDYRTGSSLKGSLHDNDLVIAGCGMSTDAHFDIMTTTIHTGPGRDWFFVRDLDRAGVDLGCGEGGRTNVTDRTDGDDLVVIRGNSHDFRVFGGFGNDTMVWYVDDNIQTEAYLAPNFFGGGASGDAIWADPGIDRIVLAIPTTTTLVTTTPTPPGGLLIKPTTGAFVDDAPTHADPYATYCVECGTGPGGRKTVIFEYRALAGMPFTGYAYINAIEEIQVGIGEGARVYHIDDTTGTATLDEHAIPTVPPSFPAQYCEPLVPR